LQEFQWRYVSHVVTLCNNNLSLAAERLGLHRHTVGKILRIGNPREIGSPCTSGNQLEKQQ
jgi:ActR/RegA family two-component response regulator